MRNRPHQAPPQWWSPKLSRFWVSLCRPFRRMAQRCAHLVNEIQVHGVEHLRDAMQREQGILITPNHPGSADAYIMQHVADQVGQPFYFMAAWQLFDESKRLGRFVLRKHGVFSVDREGTDIRAFKQAVQILSDEPAPLVIFPEGEVYHVNDRLTPLREGAAAIALSAVRRGQRPLAIVPTAIKYQYLEDPRPELLKVMDELETKIFWRPQRHLDLAERIYRFAEGPLALKELEYLGSTSAGPLPDRVAALRDAVLSQWEEHYGQPKANATAPERIKALRHQIIKRIDAGGDGSDTAQHSNALDDVFFCVQLFSYPGDYVVQSPTIERIAETIDKFAEDVLGKSRTSVCAPRRVVVSLGDPIAVDHSPDAAGSSDRKAVVSSLTRQLEERMQRLLDEMPPSPVSIAD
ncbi:MAG: 1-acyl-sn-glycerol-3-phosphate acyltransferase [Planctomycetota bacterium]|nr:MAG: 1-acyl-sn-glycerol-3-phosphate acyltransferase [Planctomycetota bacterium]